MTMVEAPPEEGRDESSAPARRHTVRWIAGVLAVVVVLLVGLLATRPPAGTRVVGSPLVGLQAPPVEGPAFDGEVVALSDFRGQWVLVNFFATWCAPCREEHDDLRAFARRHERRGDATVLAILYDKDDGETARRYFAEHGGSWPVVDDRSATVDFGVRGVPESFLVRPDGVVALRIIGGVEVDRLEELLARAQAGAS